METWIDQTEIHHGPVFSVWSGTVKLDDGTSAKREVVRHQGSVAVVPVIENCVILLRQFRISIGKDILEIPAGRIEAGETATEAAHRELKEEVGFRGRLVPSLTYYSSVGFLDEEVHVFLAFDLEMTKPRRERDECFQVIKMPMTEVAVALHSGEFDDAKTVIGLRQLAAHFADSTSDVSAIDLYGWYSDENHKYNTLIWQFPAALVGLNLLALDRKAFVTNPKAMLVMFVLNLVLLLCVAKHVYHQRCFTKSLQALADIFKLERPALPVVEFPRTGINSLSRLPVTWVLFWSLFLMNFLYVWAILR